jgi:hypothetical protein
LQQDSAVIAQLKYTHDERLDLWAEAGSYDESDNDNLAVGLNIYF